jgi:N-acetylneuraminate synthase
MAVLSLSDNTIIGDYKSPYIIAEVNSSHNGNKETAKEMIKAAKNAGCNCVKFQSWSPESLYSKTYYDKNPISKRIVQKFSFSKEDLKEMADYCKENSIGFSSTPYSRAEVDFLADECDVPFIKIASMEINNYDYLRYIAKKQKPIILSTGMADLDEIEKAVNVIERTGNNQLCLLHCISIYPADSHSINLNNIVLLRENYPQYPIGFSDHTLGYEISCAAVALGAAVIEKHLTLDKSKMGMDNNMAIEPDEMGQLVACCKNINVALGKKIREVSSEEKLQRLKMRRSIIAIKDLKEGEILKREDLDAKRPGDGISPDKIDMLIGKKLKKDITGDSLIYLKDVE